MAWHSLYLPCEDAAPVVAALRDHLAALDYTLYNPFEMTPGTGFHDSVRLFVAPPQHGWTRVLGAPDERLLAPLSQMATVLYARLSDDDGTLGVYVEGAEVDLVAALTPHLRADRSVDDLRRALAAQVVSNQTRGGKANDDLPPLEALPEDVQAMAKQLNPRQIQRLFGKLMKKVNQGVSGDTAAAQALLKSGANWESADGRRIRAVMGCLNVPDDWRTPDFVSLRDAYQRHHRRARNPHARLYPGDAEAMAAVDNALDYTPVYGGVRFG